MANSTLADPEKMDTTNPGDEENNVEDEEEEDGPDEEEEDLEQVETVVVGQTYKCRRSDNTLHAAEIVKTRKTKDSAEEYYVHYAGLTRRQNEWVDKSRVLQVREAQQEEEEEEEQEEEANGLPDGKGARGNKRKLEDGDSDHKKRKVDDEDSFVEELTCPLCKSLFKDPVILECGHNFCKLCIDKAWEGSSTVLCPECKDGVALANLVKKATVSVKEVVKPKEKCDEHDKRLKFFCKDDGILMCVICRDSLKHAAHNFLPIQDAMGVYRDQLIALVTTLKTTLKEKQKMKTEQSQKISVHKDNIADYKKHIETEFFKLHAFLREKVAQMVRPARVG